MCLTAKRQSQTEIANQIKLSIKVQKSKLWKFLRIWWCVSNWIFPSFFLSTERNKCKKTTERERSLFFRFCGRHVLASFFFFPFSKALLGGISSLSSPSFLITKGAQTQGHPRIFKQVSRKLTKHSGPRCHILFFERYYGLLNGFRNLRSFDFRKISLKYSVHKTFTCGTYCTSNAKLNYEWKLVRSKNYFSDHCDLESSDLFYCKTNRLLCDEKKALKTPLK